MNIVGIDGATKHTGISLFTDDKYSNSRAIDCSKIINSSIRLNEMILNIYAVLKFYEPNEVVMENSWVGENKNVARMISEILGAVRGFCASNKIVFIEYEPCAWRALVDLPTGRNKRELLKKMAVERVKKEYGICVTDDEAESILITQARVNERKKR